MNIQMKSIQLTNNNVETTDKCKNNKTKPKWKQQ